MSFYIRYNVFLIHQKCVHAYFSIKKNKIRKVCIKLKQEEYKKREIYLFMWLGSLMGLRALIVRWRFIDFEKKKEKKKRMNLAGEVP
jgi:hypothetical protein